MCFSRGGGGLRRRFGQVNTIILKGAPHFVNRLATPLITVNLPTFAHYYTTRTIAKISFLGSQFSLPDNNRYKTTQKQLSYNYMYKVYIIFLIINKPCSFIHCYHNVVLASNNNKKRPIFRTH